MTGQDDTTIGLFRLDPGWQNGSARASSIGPYVGEFGGDTRGLQAGDKVVLSDLSAYDNLERVHIK